MYMCVCMYVYIIQHYACTLNIAIYIGIYICNDQLIYAQFNEDSYCN